MKERTTLTSILKGLAEGSSLHGVPKIVSSKQKPIKVLWCLLLAGTFTVLAIQLFILFNEFYSYPIKTTVSLKFSPLPFPAITFCNMNPVKSSHVKTYPNLQEIIHLTQIEKVTNGEHTGILETALANPESNSTTYTSTASIPEVTQIVSGGSSTDKNTKTPSKTTTDDSSGTIPDNSNDDSQETDYYWPDTDTNETDLDYLDWDYFDYYFDDYDSYYDNSIQYARETFINEQLSSQKDKWDERRMFFRATYKNESLDSRKKMGHSLEDMVVSATFGSILQNISKFEQITTTEYGNCYTMTSPKYIAMRSGMAHGIKLTLNLEIDEYVKSFASGYGVRVVFHERGTFPLPAEEGMTLSPGYETSVGLKVVRLKRLGSPYGECAPTKRFYKKYRVKYNVQVCVHLCRIESTIESCGCIPADAPDLNISSWNVPICSNEDRRCQLTVEASLDQGTDSNRCNCISPCRETAYQKTISGRHWPNGDYLKHVLMRDVCSRNITSMNRACSKIKNGTFVSSQYQHNFIRLLVYFEDLNFESITEEPQYEPVRFVSDIGGAMGLFLGASLLSLVEGLQLAMELILFMYRGRRDPGKYSDSKEKVENLDSAEKPCINDPFSRGTSENI